MKVKEIYIKEFRQFKDFTLDLTYPKGHAKEGLPLDKVCFIGQSGTGKTNLLKLLYLLQMPGNLQEKLIASTSELIDKVVFRIVNSRNREMLSSFKSSPDDVYAVADTMITSFNLPINNYVDIIDENFKTPESAFSEIMNFFGDEVKDLGRLIYFPASLKFDLKETKHDKNIQNKKVFDFSKESISELWHLIIEEVTKYQEEILRFQQRISLLAEHGNIISMQKEVLALKEWKDLNQSPITDIAEQCINALIKNFSLRVKEDSSIEKKEDIGFIKLESLDGKEMPYTSWSTGTKQVVLSALPLYLIKPEDSTILFDEPETSLYPDLQRIIIDYYQGLTKNCQFFYATHSPIIAASFEPWEIVELKFDDKGYVYREKYYEEENHVDNYYIDPRFLNFDLMLKEVFDMKYTNGDQRYEALSEYGMLKNQLDSLRKEGKLQTDNAKTIYKKFKTLSRKLVVTSEHA